MKKIVCFLLSFLFLFSVFNPVMASSNSFLQKQWIASEKFQLDSLGKADLESFQNKTGGDYVAIVHKGSNKFSLINKDGKVKYTYKALSGTEVFVRYVSSKGYVYISEAGTGVLKSLTLDGKVRWSSKVPGNPFRTSFDVDINGNIYMMGTDQFLYVMDSKNGKIKWKYSTKHFGQSLAAFSWIATQNGDVILPSVDYKSLEIIRNGKRISLVALPKGFSAGNKQLNPLTGQVIISLSDGLADGTTKGKHLIAAYSPSGKLLWTYKEKISAVRSPSILTNKKGNILIEAEDGSGSKNYTLLDSKGRKLSAFKLNNNAGSTLHFGDDNSIYKVIIPDFYNRLQHSVITKFNKDGKEVGKVDLSTKFKKYSPENTEDFSVNNVVMYFYEKGKYTIDLYKLK